MKKKKIITHSGVFHTDDVFAVTTLALLLDKRGEEYEIIRTRDLEIIETGDFVVDVGWVYDTEKNRFDHHQEGGAGERKNGIPYSSFGLVWKEYGEELCGSSEVANIIEKRFCYPVDSADNAVETFKQVSPDIFPYIIHNVTLVFRPTWKEEESGKMNNDEAFTEYFKVSNKILSREIVNATDEIEGRVLVMDAYGASEDKRIIVIEGHYPWEVALAELPEPLYVVKPGRQNHDRWRVKAVRNDANSFENRKSLPEAWAGKRDKELADITGVPDALFCHNKRFIAGAGSKEGALALARLAVDNRES